MKINYSAIDVANYIVWFVGKESLGDITPLKLQKILYYIVAYYYKDKNLRLFSEDIEKWKYGPVVPSVYHGFKSKGIEPILSPLVTLEEDTNSILGYKRQPFDEGKFITNNTFTEIANPIIKDLISKDAFKLVEITHKEHAWKRLEPQILQGFQNYTYSDAELNKANFDI